jgi:hypothetical protein
LLRFRTLIIESDIETLNYVGKISLHPAKDE